MAENGYVGLNKSQNYYFRDMILKEETSLTFQLHVNSGTAWLKMKLCKAVEDNEEAIKNCAIPENELLIPDPDEEYFQDLGKATIKHVPEGCKNYGNWLTKMFTTPKPSCMYSIGIIGLSEQDTHYGVSVMHNEASSFLLREGSLAESNVGMGEYKYFKIQINDDDVT